jgi:hypothetical protein
MAKLFGAQKTVLQAIHDSPKNAAGFVTDVLIAGTTRIALDDIRDWFDTLDGEGLLEVARTTEGLSASITAKGRLQLSKDQQVPTGKAEVAGHSTTGSVELTATEPQNATTSGSLRPSTITSAPTVAPTPPLSAFSGTGADQWASGALDGYQAVLLIHGIRTQADWGPMVRSRIEIPGEIEVIPIKYGYFDAFRFWFPYWTRTKPIERVYKQIRVALQKHKTTNPDAKLSIIAHSFGTYIIGQILRREFDLKIHRLILCGSVLPQNFPWEQYQGRFHNDKVINECGKADIWPVLAQSASWGYGASGTHGFGAVLVKDRFHAGGHGQYFEPEFVETYWEPFIRRGIYKASDYEVTMPPTPWRLSVLGILPIQLIVSGLLLLILCFGVYFALLRPSHSPRDSTPPSIFRSDPPPDIAMIKSPRPSQTQPITVRNLTNRPIRLWYYPYLKEPDLRGWRSKDIESNEDGIDGFPVGYCYIQIQDLADSFDEFMRNNSRPPLNVGWKEFNASNEKVVLSIDGDFSLTKLATGEMEKPAVVNVEYIK